MAPSGPAAAFKLTPILGVKIIASMILSVLGMYYLNYGYKERDAGPMIKGAILVLLSLFLFF
jgi:hypothetical protein